MVQLSHKIKGGAMNMKEYSDEAKHSRNEKTMQREQDYFVTKNGVWEISRDGYRYYKHSKWKKLLLIELAEDVTRKKVAC